MLFDAAHFEQQFSENSLRKALRLVGRGKTELLHRRGSHELLFTSAGKEVKIKKYASKILDYTCSCGQKFFCEHLAAALFVMQEEKSGHKKEENYYWKAGRAKTGKQPALKKLNRLKLPSLLEKKDPELKTILRKITEEACFDTYLLLFEYLLGGSKKAALNKSGSKLLHLADMLLASGKWNKKYRGEFYAHLALCCSYKHLAWMNRETVARHLNASLQHLRQCFNKGLSQNEKHAWETAALLSVNNQKNFESGAWKLILPLAFSWSRSRGTIAELRDHLTRRRRSASVYQRINQKAIVIYQALIKEHQLAGKVLQETETEQLLEFLIAGAELFLLGGSKKKAFRLIKEAYEIVCHNRQECFDEFITYAIRQAVGYDESALHLFFTEERLLKQLFINQQDIEAWISLLPARQRVDSVNRLLARLRESRYSSFEKTAAILLYCGRYGELLKEIKKQDHAFLLLHQLALKQLPAHDTNLTALYAKHLAVSMTRIRLYSGQLQLFKTALPYLKALPLHEAEKIMDVLCTGLGEASNISRNIRDTFYESQ